MKAVLTLAVVSAITLDASTADACSRFTNQKFWPDMESNADDHTSPSAAAVKWRVTESEGGGTCEAVTILAIDVSATDDRSRVGYLVRLVEGDVYAGQFRDEPVSSSLLGSLMYYFGPDEDLFFKLEISAVDENNNVGPPTLVEIDHAGCGCSNTSPDFAVVSVFAPLALVLRRRRR